MSDLNKDRNALRVVGIRAFSPTLGMLNSAANFLDARSVSVRDSASGDDRFFCYTDAGQTLRRAGGQDYLSVSDVQELVQHVSGRDLLTITDSSGALWCFLAGQWPTLSMRVQ